MSRRINRVRYILQPCNEEVPFDEIKAILRGADSIIGSGGRGLLAKILKGSKDKRLLELGLDSNPSYGFYKNIKINQITPKIDWLIHNKYLVIRYDYRLPVIVYSDKGWKIERDTYSDELILKFQELFDSNDLTFIDTLRDRNRGMIFLLLDKIADSGEPRFIPILKYWKTIDYNKVKSKIDDVIYKLKRE